jgi:hypothetical protein
LIIRETRNVREIKSILCHPDIFYYVKGNQEIEPDEFNIDFESIICIGGYDKEIFAVGCFHAFRDGLKFHPSILPEYRLKYARDFVSSCISMVECMLYVEIPNNRKRLLNLAKKFGFDSIDCDSKNNSANTLLIKR